MLSFTPLLLAAFPSVQYRLYGSNLTSTPRWTVHAIRLLASSTCDPSTIITVVPNVTSSGIHCQSPISALCLLNDRLYPPSNLFRPDQTPSLYVADPWARHRLHTTDRLRANRPAAVARAELRSAGGHRLRPAVPVAHGDGADAHAHRPPAHRQPRHVGVD